MFLLFLFNFIWHLRSQGAEGKTRIRHAWQKLTRAFGTPFSKGGTDMRTIPPRLGNPVAAGIALLLILAFPGSLYASDFSLVQQTRVPRHCQQVMAVSVTRDFWLRGPEHRERRVLLMDADVRLRAAAAICSNPTLEKAVEHAEVPLRMIVITASPLLEV